MALFVLTTMEGAVMLARAYRSIEPYDAAVTQLRDYFDRLLRDGTDWSAPRPSARAIAVEDPNSNQVPIEVPFQVQTRLVELEGGNT